MPKCGKYDKTEELLRQTVTLKASDLYLLPEQIPFVRVDGKPTPLNFPASDAAEAKLWSEYFLTTEQQRLLERDRTAEFSWSGLGRRWRGNMYYVRGNIAVVLRLVPERIPTLAELGLDYLRPLAKLRHGLLLVTGYAGSGKTTTLAALLTMMADMRPMHIVTLEDPIEYIYAGELSLFSQRELGRDFLSFPQGIKSALRQMPDAVLVGEIRDRATMTAALSAAESGLLVLGTLHTPRAAETVGRVEGLFPVGQRDAVRTELAAVLAGVVSERLLPAVPRGRVALTEVLLPTPAVKNMIRQGKFAQLESAMLSGEKDGMRTRLNSLQTLRRDGKISEEVFRAVQEDEGL